MTSFITMSRSITRRLLQRRLAIILMLLAVGPAAVLFFVPADELVGAAHDVVAELLFRLAVPVASLLVAAGALGEERRGQTLHYLLVKPHPRSLIAGAGLASGVFAAAFVMAVGSTALIAVIGFRIADWSIAGPLLGSAAVTAIAYGAAFVPLGLITRRATVIGLAFVVIWENALGSVADTLASASLWRIGLSAYVDLADLGRRYGSDLGNVTPGAGGALAKALVLALLSVGLTTYLLRRRDLV